MRLGLDRRVKIRIFPAHSAPFFNNLSRFFVFFLVFTIVFMGIAYYYARICPLIAELARHHCTQQITSIINKTVADEIESGGFCYEDFSTIQRGESGEVRAIFMNTGKINKLKATLAVKLQEKIASQDKVKVKIPLGAILEGYIFAGVGPYVELSLVPTGYALIDFESSFFDAGINQTKHQLDITVSADFGIIMAGGGEAVNVTTKVPVAQTIIVGDVPQAFFGTDKK